MHEVHTCMRRDVPATLACTTWRLGLKRRGVRRCEKETLLPKPGPLPQMSQTEATGSLLSEVKEGCRPGAAWARSRRISDAGPLPRTKSPHSAGSWGLAHRGWVIGAGLSGLAHRGWLIGPTAQPDEPAGLA